jgi:23S rRNA U2552 (ribose-2'-O)-methylase RlmE/FtsJ
MRRHELNLDDYDTDKVPHGYLETYDAVLAPYLDRALKLLELGIHRGGSLHLWRDYFPRGEITGVDIELPTGFIPGERVQMFQGDQADVAFLSTLAQQAAPDGFDVIIDDASHIAAMTERAFWFLFDHHLRPGGLYVIEDWGTGYWADWPDGQAITPFADVRGRLMRRIPQRFSGRLGIPFPSHDYGTVGFIKQLVDEQGATDRTRARSTGVGTRGSKFAQILITPSIVFVTKRADA